MSSVGEQGKGNGKGRLEDCLLPAFEEVTFPSGLIAKLRPPSLEYFIRTRAALPSRLATAATSPEEIPQPLELSDDETLTANYALAEYAFVEPRCSRAGEAGTFHPSQLRLADWTFLQTWATRYLAGGGGDALVPFRTKSAASRDTREGSGAIREDPELL